MANDSNNHLPTGTKNHHKQWQSSETPNRPFDDAYEEVQVQYDNGLASVKASILNRMVDNNRNDADREDDGQNQDTRQFPASIVKLGPNPFRGIGRKGDMNVGKSKDTVMGVKQDVIARLARQEESYTVDWESMSPEAQKEYLKKHPSSHRGVNKKDRGKPGPDSLRKIM